MSERKSWDVQPKRKPVQPAGPASREHAPPAAARTTRPAAPVRDMHIPAARTRAQAPQAPVPAVKSVRTIPHQKKSQPLGALRQRRQKQKTVMRYVMLVVLLTAIAGAWYALWLPMFRIQTVAASGPGADIAKQIVLSQVQGSYYHLFPKNSAFLFPKERVRSAILNTVPEASAVSLTYDTFSAISIQTTPRAEAFVWCGTDINTPFQNGTCYSADVEGFIFAPSSQDLGTSTASTTPRRPQGEVRVFGPVSIDVSAGAPPIGAHIIVPVHIVEALKFVDTIRGLGAPVSSLAIRGDEADLWLNGPTRITYVLGHEEEAAELAASALPSLPLTNGSIQYVDLRFSGKAYIKRYGE